MEYAAAKIIDDMSGADMVIDIHASNIFLKEIPQICINERFRHYGGFLSREVTEDMIGIVKTK